MNNDKYINNNNTQLHIINNNIIPIKFIKHKIEKKNNCIIITKIFNKN